MMASNWGKIISIFLYMLPWSDALTFGNNLFIQFPFLQWLILPSFPIIFIERSLPFGSFLLFIILFIGVIRNPKIPYFIRFNSLQALLINIVLILINYGYKIILLPTNSALFTRTFSNLIFIATLSIVIFSIIECLRGNEPDIPGVSEAVRMQL